MSLMTVTQPEKAIPRYLGKPYSNQAFLLDFIMVLATMRVWIAGLLVLIAASSALAPSVAWITKEVLSGIEDIDRSVIIALILAWGPIYLFIRGLETALKFLGKLIDKLIDIRLLIVLQRLYLDRRMAEAEGKDASQVLFGARIANKGFDIIYKQSWRIITMLISVFLWQLTLGAEWIWLMALSVLAPSIFVWKLGPWLQNLSRDILLQHEDIASNTRAHKRASFERAQDDWMNTSIRFEIIKWVTNEGANLLLWFSLIFFVLISYMLDLGLIPQEVNVPAAAAFLVNLSLVAKPMMEISKSYTKWRESYPAMLAVFTGGEMQIKKKI